MKREGLRVRTQREIRDVYRRPCPACGGSNLLPYGERCVKCGRTRGRVDRFDRSRLEREAVGFYLLGRRFLNLTDDFARAVAFERVAEWQAASIQYQIIINSVLTEGENPSLSTIGAWLPPTRTGGVWRTGNVSNLIKRFVKAVGVSCKEELRKDLLRGLTTRQAETMLRYMNPAAGPIPMDSFDMKLLMTLSALPPAA
jgi:hypothetical protein